MDYYIDIQLLPDPEFKESMLMGALFNKLHRVLVELNSSNIAVSFPKYFMDKKEKGLGALLRLHGAEEQLNQLMEKSWLKGMSDHITKTGITQAPHGDSFIQVRRKQNKYSNMAKLRRRYIKRHNISEDEAIKLMPDDLTKRFPYPFVNVKSSSTNETFPLYIEQKVVDKLVVGKNFNCYGLDKDNASLPLF